MKHSWLLLAGTIFSSVVTAQQSTSISGIVLNKNTQQVVQGATISLQPSNKAVLVDSTGRFTLKNIIPGTYTVTIKALGYKTETKYNVILNVGNETSFTVELEPEVANLQNVTVRSSRRTAKAATLETPLSVQRLTTEEIKANPGGNFDISRVIQSLPGVGGTAGSTGAFRNDIIIRGGAPNENVFYLDGIEIPNINHFATQGSGGGPTGILNVSFIEDVKLSSSAFDARFDNTLSSVFEFKQKRGSLNRTQGNIRLSATEVAATLEGPLSQKSKATYLASVRRSYLQFLFQAIDLPIRPNYWDFQFKVTQPLNKKLTLTLLGIGAIDEFSFAAPKEATPDKLYVLNSQPSIEQNTYTVGAALRHTLSNGYWNLAVSRNYLDNNLQRFENNLGPDKGAQTLNTVSKEAETKLRFDVNQTFNGFKLSYGITAQQANYSNSTFALLEAPVIDNNGNVISPAVTNNFNGKIDVTRVGGFVQVGKRFIDNRLGVSAGLRTDGNSFTDNGWDFLRTLSPRVALSYILADKWTLNASVGRYYKLPPYTILGFQNNNGQFTNRDAKYIESTHYVLGLEYLPSDATRFTIEGFYKRYNNVPVSSRNGISLSNLGGDFGVFGNEDVVSNGKGRAWGFEFFAQQKLTKRFFGVLSYTYFVSEYAGLDRKFVASAWDNRHLLSVTWGYKFPKNWELGLKFRYQGGAPFTPFDEQASRENFLTMGTGILDYNRLNSNRLNAFHASDVRIDKKWNFKKVTLDVFLDVSNWYIARNPAYPNYTFRRNDLNTAFLTTDGQPIRRNGSNAIPTLLANDDPSVTPTIGFIVEF